MNFYPFHIGDYASATMHLSWDEDMAYRRMLDVYYARESALPGDVKQVCRLVRATSKAQRDAVATVLAEFFTLTDAGYENRRVEAEIAIAGEKAEDSETRKENEKERQRRHRDERKALFEQLRAVGVVPAYDTPSTTLRELVTTHCGNAYVTPPVTRDERQTQRLPNPNPNPNPNIDGFCNARASGADLERLLRQAAGWESEPSPNLAVTGPIEALYDAGADLELDILPTVRAIAPQARKRSSWRYFVDAIRANTADRMNNLKPINASEARTDAPRRSKPEPKPIIEGVHEAFR